MDDEECRRNGMAGRVGGMAGSDPGRGRRGWGRRGRGRRAEKGIDINGVANDDGRGLTSEIIRRDETGRAH